MKSLINKIRYNPEYEKINHTINTSMCLGCLGLSQVIKGTIVAVYPHFLPIFFCIQFFGSTIQGSLSDIYKRAVVLNISLGILILAIFTLIISGNGQTHFVHFTQIICITCIGLGGNADVVGRSEIVDLHYHMDRRKIMSWTVLAEAFSWVIIGLLMRYLNLKPFNIFPICLTFAVVLLPLSLLFNTDKTEDKKHLQNMKNELNLLVSKNLKKLSLITILIIVAELGYFFFFYSQEHHITKNIALLADSYLSWFIGMSFGCWILTKIKSSYDFIFLILGFAISLFSIVLFIFWGMKDISNPNMFYVDSLIYTITGFGSGLYLPSFYAMISREHSIHFQGILTGWVDSIRILGDALSNAVLLGFALISTLAPIFISGFLFLLSMLILITKRRKLEKKN